MDNRATMEDARDSGSAPGAAAEADSTRGRAAGFDAQAYHDLSRLIERLHRRFLDVLRTELNHLEINDINAVQCLLLSNIGDEEINVRNLMEKGYYLGSNASYNIKKLVEAGYLNQERSPHDRRSTILRLSEKGLSMCAQIRAAEDKLAATLSDSNLDLDTTLDSLLKVERVWADRIRYGS
ncbi:MAG: winged helix DNA-binding protein [Minwuiales bacterium]|nr:winged helix DNA-binding protein [Minwuiales bacterium]